MPDDCGKVCKGWFEDCEIVMSLRIIVSTDNCLYG